MLSSGGGVRGSRSGDELSLEGADELANEVGELVERKRSVAQRLG